MFSSSHHLVSELVGSLAQLGDCDESAFVCAESLQGGAREVVGLPSLITRCKFVRKKIYLKNIPINETH